MTNYYLTGIATAFSFSLFLTLAQPLAAAASTETPISLNEKKPGEKIPLKNTKLTRNNASVKIYPDILKRIMHVVAKEKAGKEIDFSVFDKQGTLMMNYKMKAGEHGKIAGLARGTYTYRVFCDEEETATGKFEIK